jgi:hypothetical protein
MASNPWTGRTAITKEVTMAQAISTFITRREVVAGLVVTAAATAVAEADDAYAQDSEKSLYERLGGVFAIAAVVDHFSDALVKNPIVEKSKHAYCEGHRAVEIEPQAPLSTPRGTWLNITDIGDTDVSALSGFSAIWLADIFA